MANGDLYDQEYQYSAWEGAVDCASALSPCPSCAYARFSMGGGVLQPSEGQFQFYQWDEHDASVRPALTYLALS